MKNDKKRVMFTFDKRSLNSLQKMKERGGFSSLAGAVRSSLQISRGLQDQSSQGFTEVIVRNPSTGAERVMVIPDLDVGASDND